MSANDRRTLEEALDVGVPCIAFVPVRALQRSMSVLKPEGYEGYFVARVPALFADGTVKYLYKEEFTLWLAVQALKSTMEPRGRTYILLGLHQEAPIADDRPYLDPRIFYQTNRVLLDVDFDEEVRFFRTPHSPRLALTYFRSDHNVRVRRLGVVNFTPVGLKHRHGDEASVSQYSESYARWKDLGYPTSGAELEELLGCAVQAVRSGLDKVRGGS